MEEIFMKKEIIKNMNNHNVYLSEYACPDSEAIRLINISSILWY